jgi:hypothetical protein
VLDAISSSSTFKFGIVRLLLVNTVFLSLKSQPLLNPRAPEYQLMESHGRRTTVIGKDTVSAKSGLRYSEIKRHLTTA